MMETLEEFEVMTNYMREPELLFKQNLSLIKKPEPRRQTLRKPGQILASCLCCIFESYVSVSALGLTTSFFSCFTNKYSLSPRAYATSSSRYLLSSGTSPRQIAAPYRNANIPKEKMSEPVESVHKGRRDRLTYLAL